MVGASSLTEEFYEEVVKLTQSPEQHKHATSRNTRVGAQNKGVY